MGPGWLSLLLGQLVQESLVVVGMLLPERLAEDLDDEGGDETEGVRPP